MPDSPSPVEDGRDPMTNPPSVSGPAGEDERRMRFIARRVDVIRNNITRVSDTAHLEPDLVFLFDQLSALTARCATLEQELADVRAVAVGEMARRTDEAMRRGAEVGYHSDGDAYAALFGDRVLSEAESLAAILIILTRNGVPAHDGDGTCILAQAFAKRIYERVNASPTPSSGATRP